MHLQSRDIEIKYISILWNHSPVCEPPPLLQEAPLCPEPVVPALRVAPQPLGQRVRPREDLALYGGGVDLDSINL